MPKTWLLRLAGAAVLLLCAMFLFGVLSHYWVGQRAEGRLFDSLRALPPHRVALVLGTAPRVKGGQDNLYFRYRMAAAAELYHSGKAEHLLLSGANPSIYYNEPQAMRRALLALGVPDAALTLDYAGLRTLDSVWRCHHIFKQRRVIIVSQDWHNRRAIFLAQAYGLDAVGYNARDVPSGYSHTSAGREWLARSKAVLDVYVLRKKPKFAGQPEPIF